MEGCERRWGLSTKRLLGENGVLKQAAIVQVSWSRDAGGRWIMEEVPGTEEKLDVDMILLSMGFTQPVLTGLPGDLDVELDARGNVKVNENKMTSLKGVFAAGDVERGASLVVHAIQAGIVAAEGINDFLKK
jgi:glutamate synthase (NADPH/NADH) small chain